MLNILVMKAATEQEKRFNTLVSNTNLVKLGKIICKNHINGYNMAHRYLKMFGNVRASMVIPSRPSSFYIDELTYLSVSAFMNSFK